MKKLLLVLILLSACVGTLRAQGTTPEDTNVETKRVVKIADKYYIETVVTTKSLLEITAEKVFDSDKSAEREKQAAEQVKKQLEDNKKATDAENLLKVLYKDAFKAGFNPEFNDLESMEKMRVLKAKILAIK